VIEGHALDDGGSHKLLLAIVAADSPLHAQ
jgi:hypothetical protein